MAVACSGRAGGLGSRVSNSASESQRMGKGDGWFGESAAGQGSEGGAGGWAGVDWGLLRESFWAKVSGRESASVWAFVSFASGLVSVTGGGAGLAKGLVGAADPDADLGAKGFVEADDALAKGFARAVVAVPGFTPKSASPSPRVAALGAGAACVAFSFPADCCLSLLSAAFCASCEALTPLIARMDPSFLRQLFLLQAKMYSRRSWPGNRSGSSALSWRRRTMRSLQTLHLASAADGALEESIQSYMDELASSSGLWKKDGVNRKGLGGVLGVHRGDLFLRRWHRSRHIRATRWFL